MRPKLWFCAFVVGLALASAKAEAETVGYAPLAGPYKIDIFDAFELYLPAQDKTLKTRIVVPQGPGPFPTIIFSHGGGRAEYLPGYNQFTDHWASHGYVVLQPTHLDAELSAKDFGKAVRQEFSGIDPLTAARLSDIRFLVDMLPAIEWGVPGLAGKIDQSGLVMAGHSRGSAATMLVGGVVLKDPRDEALVEGKDDRFDALVFLSEPGNAVFMPKEPWRNIIDLPLLVTTGTNDFGAVARVQVGYTYGVVPQGPPTGPKSRLFIKDLDQHFGGLVSGKDTIGKGPDHNGLTIVKGVSTAFLNAHMKEDWVAVEFLSGDDIEEITNGRATFTE